ncbi:hypothetical protein [Streptomyces flaveolus]
MEPTDMVTRYGIDLMCLDPAPAPPARAQTVARVQALPSHLCTVCG